MDLPKEIRLLILDAMLVTRDRSCPIGIMKNDPNLGANFRDPLFRVSKSIREDALTAFYGAYEFEATIFPGCQFRHLPDGGWSAMKKLKVTAHSLGMLAYSERGMRTPNFWSIITDPRVRLKTLTLRLCTLGFLPVLSRLTAMIDVSNAQKPPTLSIETFLLDDGDIDYSFSPYDTAVQMFNDSTTTSHDVLTVTARCGCRIPSRLEDMDLGNQLPCAEAIILLADLVLDATRALDQYRGDGGGRFRKEVLCHSDSPTGKGSRYRHTWTRDAGVSSSSSSDGPLVGHIHCR